MKIVHYELFAYERFTDFFIFAIQRDAIFVCESRISRRGVVWRIKRLWNEIMKDSTGTIAS
jgi:hypothetical protein